LSVIDIGIIITVKILIRIVNKSLNSRKSKYQDNVKQEMKINNYILNLKVRIEE